MQTHSIRSIAAAAVSFGSLCAVARGGHPVEYDILVYGGTSGGVTAAVQAARMGKTVAIVNPIKHLGGLTTSGLGWTDLGKQEILGGLSREFYNKIYVHYWNKPVAWDKQTQASFPTGAQGGPAFNHTMQIASVFEPKVAKAVFDNWTIEYGIPVFEARLDLQGGVVMSGGRIAALEMEDGRTFRAKMFIDASYEGDVLAGAGVSHTIGREANATYGESISGIQGGAGSHQLTGIDPYVVKGNAASGLLPGVEPGLAGPNGTGDHRLQAYCFRMCLTSLASNRVAITQPPGYNESDYEILFRSIEDGGRTGSFFKLDGMPNRKTDSNNNGGISTDFIGRNYGPGWDWATLNHAQRDALAKDHENWQRGLLWTLQNHPRVKAKLGVNLYTEWGLPADEFTDNGHWPWQLYVREARRMVSDYVMTQKNCTGSVVAKDSVGLAAYTMDSHHVQRYLSGGQVKNEGDVQSGTPAPYPVSYRSLVPKVGQCENLLVPWCLSSSHMAFGSIRMEPVFMTLGQSAATAAAIAIDSGISVQAVPYGQLEAKLRADGQVLFLGAADEGETDQEIIVDNDDPGAVLTGAWTPSSSITGHYGSNYLSDDNIGKGTKSVRYTPAIPVAGSYRVSLRWTSNANRATNVPVKIFHTGGTFQTTVNQELNGSTWNELGTFNFAAGTSGNLLLETTGSNEYVIADAARWVPVDYTALVEVYTTLSRTTRGAPYPGEFVFIRKGIASSALTVTYTVGGNASPAEFTPALGGTIVIPANSRVARLPVTALASAVPRGARTLSLQVTGATGYVPGPHASATLTMVDEAFDAWRFQNYTGPQLADPAISGALADPDGNGVRNLMEFFSGRSPSATSMEVRDGRLYFNYRRHRDASALAAEIWESDNLTSWIPTPELALPAVFDREGNYDLIGIPVRASNPFEGNRRFFQLRVKR